MHVVELDVHDVPDRAAGRIQAATLVVLGRSHCNSFLRPGLVRRICQRTAMDTLCAPESGGKVRAQVDRLIKRSRLP
jgi:hypothetical protein